MTTHTKVMELVDESAKQFLAKIENEAGERTEWFGVFRRALERGVQRLDTYGDMVVNEEKPESEIEIKENLAMLYSGVLQAAVAAVCILETLPEIPVAGFEIMTHEEHN